MNDHDRAAILQLCERLHNWRSRSQKPIAEFVRYNRDEIDRLIAADLVPPSKPVKKTWRRWEELSEKELEQIKKRVRRRPGLPREWLARLHIDSNAHSQLSNLIKDAREHPYQYHSRKATQLPEYSPDWRLLLRRTQALQWLFNQKLNPKTPRNAKCKINPKFLPNLHPDDVEMEMWETMDGTTITLTADRHCITYSGRNLLSLKCDHNTGICRGGWNLDFYLGQSPILARSHFMTDPESGAEVYYVACVSISSDKELKLQHKYIARIRDVRDSSWICTNRFSKPADALRSALQLFSVDTAKLISGE